MAYQLKEVTIRADNSADGMKRIEELWRDVARGKVPLLFDSDHSFLQGVSPVSRYANYASDESGEYDLSIIAVRADFFQSMEAEVGAGAYKTYDCAGDNIGTCAQEAWEAVWSDQKRGAIQRAFAVDYESTVPAEYGKDGKAHCYLWISVKS